MMDDQDIATFKSALREKILSEALTVMNVFLDTEAGKVAERLRRTGIYKSARCVLVPPVAFFRQTALNALLDGKRLVYPSPGVHKGFFAVDPAKIPPAQKSVAASFRSPNPWAQKIAHRTRAAVHIDLVVTPCLAAVRDGGRLGDGSGLVDLQIACLCALGWIHARTALVGIVPEANVLDALPMKSTDIRLHWIVTERRVLKTTWREEPRTPILWEMLDKRTIRRNDLLFFLKGELNSSFACR